MSRLVSIVGVNDRKLGGTTAVPRTREPQKRRSKALFVRMSICALGGIRTPNLLIRSHATASSAVRRLPLRCVPTSHDGGLTAAQRSSTSFTWRGDRPQSVPSLLAVSLVRTIQPARLAYVSWCPSISRCSFSSTSQGVHPLGTPFLLMCSSVCSIASRTDFSDLRAVSQSSFVSVRSKTTPFFRSRPGYKRAR